MTQARSLGTSEVSNAPSYRTSKGTSRYSMFLNHFPPLPEVRYADALND